MMNFLDGLTEAFKPISPENAKKISDSPASRLNTAPTTPDDSPVSTPTRLQGKMKPPLAPEKRYTKNAQRRSPNRESPTGIDEGIKSHTNSSTVLSNNLPSTLSAQSLDGSTSPILERNESFLNHNSISVVGNWMDESTIESFGVLLDAYNSGTERKDHNAWIIELNGYFSGKNKSAAFAALAEGSKVRVKDILLKIVFQIIDESLKDFTKIEDAFNQYQDEKKKEYKISKELVDTIFSDVLLTILEKDATKISDCLSFILAHKDNFSNEFFRNGLLLEILKNPNTSEVKLREWLQCLELTELAVAWNSLVDSDMASFAQREVFVKYLVDSIHEKSLALSKEERAAKIVSFLSGDSALGYLRSDEKNALMAEDDVCDVWCEAMRRKATDAFINERLCEFYKNQARDFKNSFDELTGGDFLNEVETLRLKYSAPNSKPTIFDEPLACEIILEAIIRDVPVVSFLYCVRVANALLPEKQSELFVSALKKLERMVTPENKSKINDYIQASLRARLRTSIQLQSFGSDLAQWVNQFHETLSSENRQSFIDDISVVLNEEKKEEKKPPLIFNPQVFVDFLSEAILTPEENARLIHEPVKTHVLSILKIILAKRKSNSNVQKLCEECLTQLYSQRKAEGIKDIVDELITHGAELIPIFPDILKKCLDDTDSKRAASIATAVVECYLSKLNPGASDQQLALIGDGFFTLFELCIKNGEMTTEFFNVLTQYYKSLGVSEKNAVFYFSQLLKKLPAELDESKKQRIIENFCGVVRASDVYKANKVSWVSALILEIPLLGKKMVDELLGDLSVKQPEGQTDLDSPFVNCLRQIRDKVEGVFFKIGPPPSDIADMTVRTLYVYWVSGAGDQGGLKYAIKDKNNNIIVVNLLPETLGDDYYRSIQKKALINSKRDLIQELKERKPEALTSKEKDMFFGIMPVLEYEYPNKFMKSGISDNYRYALRFLATEMKRNDIQEQPHHRAFYAENNKKLLTPNMALEMLKDPETLFILSEKKRKGTWNASIEAVAGVAAVVGKKVRRMAKSFYPFGSSTALEEKPVEQQSKDKHPYYARNKILPTIFNIAAKANVKSFKKEMTQVTMNALEDFSQTREGSQKIKTIVKALFSRGDGAASEFEFVLDSNDAESSVTGRKLRNYFMDTLENNLFSPGELAARNRLLFLPNSYTEGLPVDFTSGYVFSLEKIKIDDKEINVFQLRYFDGTAKSLEHPLKVLPEQYEADLDKFRVKCFEKLPNKKDGLRRLSLDDFNYIKKLTGHTIDSISDKDHYLFVEGSVNTGVAIESIPENFTSGHVFLFEIGQDGKKKYELYYYDGTEESLFQPLKILPKKENNFSKFCEKCEQIKAEKDGIRRLSSEDFEQIEEFTTHTIDVGSKASMVNRQSSYMQGLGIAKFNPQAEEDEEYSLKKDNVLKLFDKKKGKISGEVLDINLLTAMMQHESYLEKAAEKLAKISRFINSSLEKKLLFELPPKRRSEMRDHTVYIYWNKANASLEYSIKTLQNKKETFSLTQKLLGSYYNEIKKHADDSMVVPTEKELDLDSLTTPWLEEVTAVDASSIKFIELSHKAMEALFKITSSNAHTPHISSVNLDDMYKHWTGYEKRINDILLHSSPDNIGANIQFFKKLFAYFRQCAETSTGDTLWIRNYRELFFENLETIKKTTLCGNEIIAVFIQSTIGYNNFLTPTQLLVLSDNWPDPWPISAGKEYTQKEYTDAGASSFLTEGFAREKQEIYAINESLNKQTEQGVSVSRYLKLLDNFYQSQLGTPEHLSKQFLLLMNPDELKGISVIEKKYHQKAILDILLSLDAPEEYKVERRREYQESIIIKNIASLESISEEERINFQQQYAQTKVFSIPEKYKNLYQKQYNQSCEIESILIPDEVDTKSKEIYKREYQQNFLKGIASPLYGRDIILHVMFDELERPNEVLAQSVGYRLIKLIHESEPDNSLKSEVDRFWGRDVYQSPDLNQMEKIEVFLRNSYILKNMTAAEYKEVLEILPLETLNAEYRPRQRVALVLLTTGKFPDENIIKLISVLAPYLELQDFEFFFSSPDLLMEAPNKEIYKVLKREIAKSLLQKNELYDESSDAYKEVSFNENGESYFNKDFILELFRFVDYPETLKCINNLKPEARLKAVGWLLDVDVDKLSLHKQGSYVLALLQIVNDQELCTHLSFEQLQTLDQKIPAIASYDIFKKKMAGYLLQQKAIYDDAFLLQANQSHRSQYLNQLFRLVDFKVLEYCKDLSSDTQEKAVQLLLDVNFSTFDNKLNNPPLSEERKHAYFVAINEMPDEIFDTLSFEQLNKLYKKTLETEDVLKAKIAKFLLKKKESYSNEREASFLKELCTLVGVKQALECFAGLSLEDMKAVKKGSYLYDTYLEWIKKTENILALEPSDLESFMEFLSQESPKDCQNIVKNHGQQLAELSDISEWLQEDGYDLHLMSDIKNNKPTGGKLYIEVRDNILYYRSNLSGDKKQKITIETCIAAGIEKERAALLFQAMQSSDLLTSLAPFKSDILKVTSAKAHADIIPVQYYLGHLMSSIELGLIPETIINEYLSSDVVVSLTPNALRNGNIDLMLHALRKETENINKKRDNQKEVITLLHRVVPETVLIAALAEEGKERLLNSRELNILSQEKPLQNSLLNYWKTWLEYKKQYDKISSLFEKLIAEFNQENCALFTDALAENSGSLKRFKVIAEAAGAYDFSRWLGGCIKAKSAGNFLKEIEKAQRVMEETFGKNLFKTFVLDAEMLRLVKCSWPALEEYFTSQEADYKEAYQMLFAYSEAKIINRKKLLEQLHFIEDNVSTFPAMNKKNVVEMLNSYGAVVFKQYAGDTAVLDAFQRVLIAIPLFEKSSEDNLVFLLESLEAVDLNPVVLKDGEERIPQLDPKKVLFISAVGGIHVTPDPKNDTEENRVYCTARRRNCAAILKASLKIALPRSGDDDEQHQARDEFRQLTAQYLKLEWLAVNESTLVADYLDTLKPGASEAITSISDAKKNILTQITLRDALSEPVNVAALAEEVPKAAAILDGVETMFRASLTAGLVFEVHLKEETIPFKEKIIKLVSKNALQEAQLELEGDDITEIARIRLLAPSLQNCFERLKRFENPDTPPFKLLVSSSLPTPIMEGIVYVYWDAESETPLKYIAKTPVGTEIKADLTSDDLGRYYDEIERKVRANQPLDSEEEAAIFKKTAAYKLYPRLSGAQWNAANEDERESVASAKSQKARSEQFQADVPVRALQKRFYENCNPESVNERVENAALKRATEKMEMLTDEEMASLLSDAEAETYAEVEKEKEKIHARFVKEAAPDLIKKEKAILHKSRATYAAYMAQRWQDYNQSYLREKISDLTWYISGKKGEVQKANSAWYQFVDQYQSLTFESRELKRKVENNPRGKGESIYAKNPEGMLVKIAELGDDNQLMDLVNVMDNPTKYWKAFQHARDEYELYINERLSSNKSGRVLTVAEQSKFSALKMTFELTQKEWEAVKEKKGAVILESTSKKGMPLYSSEGSLLGVYYKDAEGRHLLSAGKVYATDREGNRVPIAISGFNNQLVWTDVRLIKQEAVAQALKNYYDYLKTLTDFGLDPEKLKLPERAPVNQKSKEYEQYLKAWEASKKIPSLKKELDDARDEQATLLRAKGDLIVREGTRLFMGSAAADDEGYYKINDDGQSIFVRDNAFIRVSDILEYFDYEKNKDLLDEKGVFPKLITDILDEGGLAEFYKKILDPESTKSEDTKKMFKQTFFQCLKKRYFFLTENDISSLVKHHSTKELISLLESFSMRDSSASQAQARMLLKNMLLDARHCQYFVQVRKEESKEGVKTRDGRTELLQWFKDVQLDDEDAKAWMELPYPETVENGNKYIPDLLITHRVVQQGQDTNKDLLQQWDIATLSDEVISRIPQRIKMAWFSTPEYLPMIIERWDVVVAGINKANTALIVANFLENQIDKLYFEKGLQLFDKKCMGILSDKIKETYFNPAADAKKQRFLTLFYGSSQLHNLNFTQGVPFVEIFNKVDLMAGIEYYLKNKADENLDDLRDVLKKILNVKLDNTDFIFEQSDKNNINKFINTFVDEPTIKKGLRNNFYHHAHSINIGTKADLMADIQYYLRHSEEESFADLREVLKDVLSEKLSDDKFGFVPSDTDVIHQFIDKLNDASTKTSLGDQFYRYTVALKNVYENKGLDKAKAKILIEKMDTWDWSTMGNIPAWQQFFADYTAGDNNNAAVIERREEVVHYATTQIEGKKSAFWHRILANKKNINWVLPCLEGKSLIAKSDFNEISDTIKMLAKNGLYEQARHLYGRLVSEKPSEEQSSEILSIQRDISFELSLAKFENKTAARKAVFVQYSSKLGLSKTWSQICANTSLWRLYSPSLRNPLLRSDIVKPALFPNERKMSSDITEITQQQVEVATPSPLVNVSTDQMQLSAQENQMPAQDKIDSFDVSAAIKQLVQIFTQYQQNFPGAFNNDSDIAFSTGKLLELNIKEMLKLAPKICEVLPGNKEELEVFKGILNEINEFVTRDIPEELISKLEYSSSEEKTLDNYTVWQNRAMKDRLDNQLKKLLEVAHKPLMENRGFSSPRVSLLNNLPITTTTVPEPEGKYGSMVVGLEEALRYLQELNESSTNPARNRDALLLAIKNKDDKATYSPLLDRIKADQNFPEDLDKVCKKLTHYAEEKRYIAEAIDNSETKIRDEQALAVETWIVVAQYYLKNIVQSFYENEKTNKQDVCLYLRSNLGKLVTKFASLGATLPIIKESVLKEMAETVQQTLEEAVVACQVETTMMNEYQAKMKQLVAIKNDITRCIKRVEYCHELVQKSPNSLSLEANRRFKEAVAVAVKNGYETVRSDSFIQLARTDAQIICQVAEESQAKKGYINTDALKRAYSTRLGSEEQRAASKAKVGARLMKDALQNKEIPKEVDKFEFCELDGIRATRRECENKFDELETMRHAPRFSSELLNESKQAQESADIDPQKQEPFVVITSKVKPLKNIAAQIGRDIYTTKVVSQDDIDLGYRRSHVH